MQPHLEAVSLSMVSHCRQIMRHEAHLDLLALRLAVEPLLCFVSLDVVPYRLERGVGRSFMCAAGLGVIQDTGRTKGLYYTRDHT